MTCSLRVGSVGIDGTPPISTIHSILVDDSKMRDTIKELFGFCVATHIKMIHFDAREGGAVARVLVIVTGIWKP